MLNIFILLAYFYLFDSQIQQGTTGFNFYTKLVECFRLKTKLGHFKLLL